MIRSVPLERLPDGLVFPEELAQRIRYDATRRRLEFDGYMSKVEFDKLLRLHNDLEYQKALERLFQICVFENTPARPKRWVAVGATLAAVLVALVSSLFALLLMHR